MYYKNFLIGIAALALAVTTAFGQCTDPNDPNCVCTNNCGDPTNSPADPYPPGSLQLLVQPGSSSISITVTNGDLWSDYLFQTSTDCISWSGIGDVFEVGSDTSYISMFTNSDTARFFRLLDVTTLVSSTAGASSVGMPCGGGSAVGYANYIETAEDGWGFVPYSYMTRHYAIDTRRTNTVIEYGGRNGDSGCSSTNYLFVNPIGSATYRFTILFPSNLPTNSYTIRLKGFYR